MSSRARLEADLSAGVAALELELPPAGRSALLDYIALLGRWNRAYNLTRVTEPQDMLRRHLLDCLAVAAHLLGPRVLDLGTGPGLPGIVLAVACPQRSFVLLDANAKKIRFCRQACAELRLDNVELEQTRAERYRPDTPFTSVVSRAFGSLREIRSAASAWLAPGGRIVAMKGRYPRSELEEVQGMGENARVIELSIPGLDAQRCLVVLEPGSPRASPDRPDPTRAV